MLMATAELDGGIPLGQGWMTKRARDRQRLNDERRERNAQAAALRLALYGPPAAVVHRGWGGITHTEGVPEVAEPSGEETSGESAQAGSDDNQASAKAQKLDTHKGARCVCHQTRDGRCKLKSGICSDRVVDCRPLHFSVPDTQGPVIDEAMLETLVQQFYVRLEWEARGRILECDVPRKALCMAARYMRRTDTADTAEMGIVPVPTDWCACKGGLALFYPLKHMLPLCCRATFVPNQDWLAAMAVETKLYYSSC